MENNVQTINFNKKSLAISAVILLIFGSSFFIGKQVIVKETPQNSPSPTPQKTEAPTISPKTPSPKPLIATLPPSPTSTPTPSPTPTLPPPPTVLPKPICLGPKAYPQSSGIAPFTVMFQPQADAGLTGGIKGYQWDFLSDGNWTSLSLNAQTYTYQNPGTFNAKLKVVAINDESSECSIAINVTLPTPAP